MSLIDRKFDLALMSILTAAYIKLRKRRYERRYWIHPLCQQRAQFRSYNNLIKKLYKYPEKFKNYCRLTIEEYRELLKLVSPLLKKNSIRKSIPPGLRLMLTLRYLATGNSMVNMSYEYRVGKTTVSKIVYEVCEAIWTALKHNHLNPPTESEWHDIARNFYTKWNFPNCLGCIDGKRVILKCPNKSGTQFENYKKTLSIVLMGVCDANHRFIFVDIGAYGSNHESGILKQSAFGKKFVKNRLNFPADQPLPKSKDGKTYPFFFIGDAAFPLLRNMLNPYDGTELSTSTKVFNYRLARARNCIERAFAVLVSRFNILFSRIQASPKTVDNIIKATVVLHNYIINKRPQKPLSREAARKCTLVLDKSRGISRKESLNLRFGASNSARENLVMRDEIKNYLVNDDIISSQLTNEQC